MFSQQFFNMTPINRIRFSLTDIRARKMHSCTLRRKNHHESIGGKSSTVYECFLLALKADNDNRAGFIGFVLVNVIVLIGSLNRCGMIYTRQTALHS